MTAAANPRLLTLRARVALSFALLSVLITGLIAAGIWHLFSNYMLNQRQSSALHQATTNAGLVERRLQRDQSAIPDLLTGLGAEAESAVLLVDGGHWISSSNMISANQLPTELLQMVADGQAATQRRYFGDTPVIVVGIPLSTQSGTFVQVFPLREMNRNFRFVSWMLVLGVVVSGAAGGVLGYWAGRRALRPLTVLTAAASAAADGDLSVRMPPSADRDLAPIATAFNEAAERLQQRVARDARFAADVSHELRSPLTTMLNAMSVLRRRRDQLTGSAQQALDLLDSELVRFQRMVLDLLEMSLSDAGAPGEALERTDLTELIAEATRHHHDQLLDLPEAPVHVMADRRRLERALVNLVHNADQHGHGVVRIGLTDTGTHARIEVDDAGPGVAPTLRERVFERFTRAGGTGEPAHEGGSGLGLALVTRHVRHHGGRVWVEDRPGGGARFVIELERSR